MRKALQKAIPSMFHRRLLLLTLCGALVTLAMAAQAARLTLGSTQAQRIAQAERALLAKDLIPTVRGDILDRDGRVLAADEPGWAIAVNYRVIAGEWAYAQAERQAYREHRSRWSELSRAERQGLIEQRYLPPFDQQVEMLWSMLGDLGRQSRSEIETRKSSITRRVMNTQSHLWARWREQRSEELGEPVDLSDVARPIAEQEQFHAILNDVDEATRRQVQNFIAEAEAADALDNPLAVWNEVKLERPRRRRYPYETMTVDVDRSYLPSPIRDGQRQEVTVRGVGIHLLGQLRDVWREDEQRRPFSEQGDLGGYLAGDRVGRFGIESSQEDKLRGHRGRVIRQLDTGAEDRIEPTPGQDVRLAVDINLQAYVQALMSPDIGLMEKQPWHGHPEEHEGEFGEPLNGAAVVLDIDTSEILAAVSVPSMPLAVLETNPDRIYNDPANMPSMNRVLGRLYQPGSVVKPLMLTAAVTEGVLSPSEVVDCPGYLWPGRETVYRDWIYKAANVPFGELNGVEALTVSSNVFFGKMFQRMGAQRSLQWYHRFGVDQSLDTGVGGMRAGRLPDPATAREQDMTFTAIGQGPISWTPLHAAGAYAALARGGLYRTPSFLRLPGASRTDETWAMPLAPAGLEMAMQGMFNSANDRTGGAMNQGTTSELHELGEPIFNAPGVRVMAKSGTAQAAPLRRPIDDDGDGYPDRYGEVLKSGNHAWVAALIQPEGEPAPTHVVVVIVEYAGSGGQVAGPVVNAIIHAMQDIGVQELAAPDPQNPGGAPSESAEPSMVGGDA